MNLTLLSEKFLTDNERVASNKNFTDSYNSFISFFKGLSGFAVYFDKANNYANTANTALLTRRLIDEADFKGKVYLVYDKDDKKLCARIKENLPFFEDKDKYTHVHFTGTEIFNSSPFILCGGSEQTDPFWTKLGDDVHYVMTIRPYLDGGDFSFIKIRHKDAYSEDGQGGQWITYFTDTISMNQLFPARNFYIDLEKIKAIPDDVKNYWKNNWDTKNLGKAEAILNSSNVSIFPISGLASTNPATDRGDNCVLILALASLAKLESDNKTAALVFTDYSDTGDRHFKLLKIFCLESDPVKMLSKLKEMYPQSSEADLKTGLLNPLMQKRSELADVLGKVVFWDGSQSFDAGKLYMCPVGNLPYDYTAALYAKSRYVFFESCDYTNLAANIGVPFLHKAIEAYSGYPEFFNPSAAAYMDSLCDIFKNDISAYTSAINKNLSVEIDAVSEFLSACREEYFAALSLYAQGKSKTEDKPGILNDKLAASAGVFYMLHDDMDRKIRRNVLSQNDDTDTGIDFEGLHKKLRGAFNEKEKTLDLSSALKGMRIAGYLQDMAGGVFVLTLDSVDDIALDYYKTDEEIPDEEKEVCGVSIVNARSTVLEGGVFEINFTDWYGGDSYGIYINGKFNQPSTLLDIPWLKFSDVNFSVITSENNMPTKGSVGATFGRTDDYYGANFVIDFNYQNDITRIMASFREPLTPGKAFNAFSAVAGGLDFESLVPEEISKYVSLGLSNLVFYYNKEKREITSMSFSFENSSKHPWVLWKKDGKALLSAKPNIGITVNSPADMANRQVLLSVGCFVDIGDKEEISNNGDIGQLWLGASYPPFVAEMRMASESIDVGGLLRLFGCAFDLELKITDLSVLADFGNKYYKLSAAVGGEWKMAENFAITGLGLHIADKADKFSTGFAGTMLVLKKINVGVAIGYDDGTWKLLAEAKLNAGDVKMSDLVKAYKGKNDLIAFNNNEEEPTVAGLKFSLTKYPAKTNKPVDFEVSAFVDSWKLSFLDKPLSASGAVGQNKDGFYGHLKASVNLLGADCILTLNYVTEKNNIQLQWGDFTGNVTQEKGETTATIELKQFSIGGMIEAFTGWLNGSKYSLDSPWDILNKLKTDIKLVYNFTKEYFELSIAVPGDGLDLVFGTLKGIAVNYNPKSENKIDVQLSIKYAWETAVETISWDASKPDTAPAPAGRGNEYFDLRYLAFGQKVRFFDDINPASTDAAIDHLIENTSPEKFPPFDINSGMLVAANFGILKEKAKNEGESLYFIDAALVFYDPALFAMRIKFAGTAAKIFDGFSFEIIYAKLSEALGVFKSTIALPNKFRQFDLGAYTISLPDFYIEIFTNGDFKVDAGFPKNGDFSRSFSLSGIVPPGIPLIGFAGFYFGKLSSASAQGSGIYLPKSDKGMFNPAIVFGVGLRIGIGKNISYGIFSGGFSLTVATILEGVIAKWNPYNKEPAGEAWYFRLEGTAALTGNVHGKIDFAIIKVSVNVTINLSVAFAYETCRATQLTVCASISASASLTINFWLFSIEISFKFSVQVKESFAIGEDDDKAPWGVDKIANNAAMLFIYPKADDAASMDFSNLQLGTGERKTNINANLSLAMTAAANEYSGKEKFVIGNVILTMEADKNFDTFAETLVYWVVAAACGDEVTKETLAKRVIDDDYLAKIEKFFEDEEMPVKYRDAESLFERFFIVNIKNPEQEAENRKSGEDVQGVYFPLPPDTELIFTESASTKYEYVLKDYNSIDKTAPRHFKEIFDRLAVLIDEENNPQKNSSGNSGISVSEWIFCDWFAIAASHAVRSMRKTLRDIGVTSCLFDEIVKEMEKNHFYRELSGMLSRFFLHGLRLPTVDNHGNKLIQPNKNGLWVLESDGKFTLPEEAGIFALTGQAFILSENCKINITSKNKWFELPKDFSLEIKDEQAKMVEALSRHAGKFSIKHAFEEIKAEFSRAVISFGKPVEINKKHIWTVPESLTAYFDGKYLAYPKFRLCLTEHTGGDIRENVFDRYSALALVEFTIRATDTKGVYVIGSSSKRVIDILRKIITLKPEKIQNVELLNAAGFFAVSQINMSTETRPPDENIVLRGTHPVETLTLLWKALITNNGGYILTYRGSENTVLDDKITLAVTFNFNFANAQEHSPLINAVSSNEKPDDGSVLTASAEEYAVTLKGDKASLAPAVIAEKYCTDVRRIAENNAQIKLKPGMEWDFVNIVKEEGSKAEIIKPFKAKPNRDENLTSFANRNHTTPAYALWLNRDNPGLFAEGAEITVMVQAGRRIPPGSENTCSKINESYVISRDQKESLQVVRLNETNSGDYAESLLRNNFTLLSYGVTGNSDNSAPHSFMEKEKDIIYSVIAPTDKYAGGEYRSAGKLVQNRFNWLDYYGNKLVPEFYSARVAGYQDPVLGLSKWQSIGASWGFTGHESIQVCLSFAADDYSDSDSEKRKEKRKHALVLYSRLLSQISDNNMTVSLKCSMFGKASKAIKTSESSLKEYIKQIVVFLKSEYDKIDTPDLKLKFSFDTGNVTASSLFPLECTFVVSRNGCAADKGCEEVDDILYTVSAVSLPDDGLQGFAENFKNIFKDYVVLKGGGESMVYAYRISEMAIDIDHEKTTLFLPRPVSNVLADRDEVEIRVYEGGAFNKKSENRSFRAVDLNVWLNNALKFADNILSADIVSAARLAKCDDDYKSILDKKKSIADTLTGMLTPAFKENAGIAAPDEAKEQFKQRMLGSLSSFYGVKAVAVLPAKVKGLPEGAAFFGNLAESNGHSLSYSSPKLKNDNRQDLIFAISGADVVLDRSGAVLPFADLKPVLNVTHIESGITPIIDGFNASAWHGKIADDIVKVPLYKENSAISVPFPLYAFPETPKMVSQDAISTAAGKGEKNKHYWRYAFSYSRSYNYPQQVCHCTVKYNTVKSLLDSNHEDALFKALAQIDASGAAILEDLNALAAKINQSEEAAPDPKSDTVKRFITTFGCAKEVITQLAAADFITAVTTGYSNTAEEKMEFSVSEAEYGDGLFGIILDCEGVEPRIENYIAEQPEGAKGNVWIFRNPIDNTYLSVADGQAISKREIIMPKKDVLRYQNAVSEVYVEQNKELGGKEMNDVFVYTTGTVAFDSAVNPSCVVDNVNLNPADGEDKKLSEILTGYLKDLCGDANVTLQAHMTYLNNLYGSIADDAARVVYPVFSQTKTPVAGNEAEKIVAFWTKAIKEFKQPFPPGVFAKGTLSFEFVFLSKTGGTPLLTIKNAHISGKYAEDG